MICRGGYRIPERVGSAFFPFFMKFGGPPKMGGGGGGGGGGADPQNPPGSAPDLIISNAHAMFYVV